MCVIHGSFRIFTGSFAYSVQSCALTLCASAKEVEHILQQMRDAETAVCESDVRLAVCNIGLFYI